MTDLLAWSIKLGRWSGVQVRVHYFLLFFAASSLFSAALAEGGSRVTQTACWLAVMFVVLVLHELGHAAVALAQNAEVEDVCLWPLGNFVVPMSPARSADNPAIAIAGPVVSGLLAFGSALVLSMYGASMVFNPFGGVEDSGAPLIHAAQGVPAHVARAMTPLWFVGWFGYLNWVICLVNLIPALPLDGGRAFRAVLARSSVGLARDHFIAPWTARTCAALLTLAGLVRMGQGAFSNGTANYFGDGLTLFALALLIELVVRSESRMMDDGGYFEDGVFGYDFSEGYTSLEAGNAKVRPARESAIKRWRRRRSELRRRRRVAREVAEERRMDEILEKLHTQGKSALTDEEHRFLVRVSAKLRSNRPRARD
ncbi:site-2 protease family protein [Tundrisphaera sp. TA3]|uniref:site-2 protease family protein n=1 Tax=Tundrisphaera sp. TA3 TaxID=3435775 RepID=UPI003EBD95E6